jgi:hypothetical protein
MSTENSLTYHVEINMTKRTKKHGTKHNIKPTYGNQHKQTPFINTTATTIATQTTAPATPQNQHQPKNTEKNPRTRNTSSNTPDPKTK